MGDPSSPTGVDSPPAVDVVVGDEQDEVAIDAERWSRLAAAVLRGERRHGELTLTFVDRGEMTALNREHMCEDGPTDVLSFPLDAADDAVATTGAPAGPILLGDVVICPAVAAEHAPGHAGTLDDELALLVVHGVLHVLGHDHAEPDETLIMRRRELELLVQHHWHGEAPAGFSQEQPS
jgi:probable rRNA maturation factor